jgi:hypothetical protein
MARGGNASARIDPKGDRGSRFEEIGVITFSTNFENLTFAYTFVLYAREMLRKLPSNPGPTGGAVSNLWALKLGFHCAWVTLASQRRVQG